MNPRFGVLSQAQPCKRFRTLLSKLTNFIIYNLYGFLNNLNILLTLIQKV